METIGLIAALDMECAALLRHVKPWKRITGGRLQGYGFVLTNHNCVLVTSGMGIRRASEAARLIVENYSPQLIITFGIAGAVSTDLDIGDVILAEAVCQLDQEVLGPLLPLAPWPEAAQEAAASALAGHGKRIFVGTAVTTGSSQVSEDQLAGLTHPVLEMETAAIAQVAAESGIPLLSMRAISDGPRAPIPIDLREVMDEDASLRIGRLLKVIVCNPKLVFQSRRIMQNTRLAAGCGGIALAAVLRHKNILNP